MKVRKAIELLSRMNPEAKLELNDYKGEEALFVMARQNDPDHVWLEGASTVDMKNEINERLDHLRELETIEEKVVFVKDMIDTGINCTMILEYVGEEKAAAFCDLVNMYLR